MDTGSSTDPYTTRASIFVKIHPAHEEREVHAEEFVAKYSPIVHGFARKLGANTHDADDVANEVLMRFFRALPAFQYDQSKGRFRGYLKTCVVRVLQELKGDRRTQDSRFFRNLDAEEPSVESAWVDVWERERLHRALRMVSDQYHRDATTAKTFRAFEMYALLQQPPEFVATELGMSVNGVHQARTRVSRALRRALDDLEYLG